MALPCHYLRCDGSARLQACVASELICWFMAVVDPIQLPRLNCCAGKSCSVLASWSASLAPLFSPFIVNDSKSLDSLRSFPHCFEASRSYLLSSSCALENPRLFSSFCSRDAAKQPACSSKNKKQSPNQIFLLVPGVVVEPIQLPRLNCCSGRSSSALASWPASLAPLFSSFAVND